MLVWYLWWPTVTSVTQVPSIVIPSPLAVLTEEILTSWVGHRIFRAKACTVGDSDVTSGVEQCSHWSFVYSDVDMCSHDSCWLVEVLAYYWSNVVERKLPLFMFWVWRHLLKRCFGLPQGQHLCWKVEAFLVVQCLTRGTVSGLALSVWTGRNFVRTRCSNSASFLKVAFFSIFRSFCLTILLFWSVVFTFDDTSFWLLFRRFCQNYNLRPLESTTSGCHTDLSLSANSSVGSLNASTK